MASKKQALAELNALNSKAQAADSIKNFILYLVRFVQKFVNIPELQTVVEAIQQQTKTDQKKVLELRAVVLTILNKIHEEYHDYCSSNGIIIETPCPFEVYDNPDPEKRIHTTRNVVIEKYEALENLLLRLAKISSDHYNFVSRFTAITQPINMYHQQVSIFLKIPAYNDWLNAQKAFEDKLPTLIGHHWDCIVCIYLAITDRDKILKPGNQNNVFEQWWVNSLRGRAINTINEKNDCDPKFDLPALKYSLGYVLDFSEEVLARSEEHSVTTNQTNTDDLTYDQGDGILYFSGEKISIDGEGPQGRFTGLFFPGGKPLVDLIPIDEIHHDVFETPADSYKLEDEEKISSLCIKAHIESKG